MVLKKSSTGLNSGATQRLHQHHKPTEPEESYSRQSLPEHCVLIGNDKHHVLTRRSPVPTKLERDLANVQSLVTDYLNQELPLLVGDGQEGSLPYSGYPRPRVNPLRAQVFSLHKARVEDLRLRMEEMFHDAQLAVDILQYDLDVQVFWRESSDDPWVGVHSKGHIVWSAFDAVAKSKSTTTDTHTRAETLKKSKAGKRRPCTNTRGLQRKSSLRRSEMEEESPEESKRPCHVLYVYVVLPGRLDSRALTASSHRDRLPKKAKSKLKHTKSFLCRERRYDIQQGLENIDSDVQMEEEEDNPLDDVYKSSVCHPAHSHTSDEHTPHKWTNDEYMFDDQSYDSLSQTFDIMDFQNRDTRKRKHDHAKHTKHRTQARLMAATPLNAWGPAKNKGFVVTLPNDLNSFGIGLTSQSVPSHSGESRQQTEEVTEEEPNTSGSLGQNSESNLQGGQWSAEAMMALEEKLDALFAHTYSPYVSVSQSFIIANEQDGRVDSSLTSQSTHDVTLKDCHGLQFGNSLPLCFITKMGPLPPCVREKYLLTGRKMPDNTWMLRLLNQEIVSEQKKLKTLLRTVVEEENKKSAITLSDLVVKVSHSIQKLLSPAQVSLLSPAQVSSFTETRIDNHTVHPNVNFYVMSPDEAYNSNLLGHCSKKSAGQKTTNVEESTAGVLDGFEVLPGDPKSECCICFLSYDELDATNEVLTFQPCLHSVCVQCWRRSAFYDLREGHTDIGCPVTKCQTRANQAVMMSFLPFVLWNKWQRRVRDRLLEVSPLSKWCPNGKCGKVVVLVRPPVKSGSCLPVQCDCGTLFCHSCQARPHYPATCEQYRLYSERVVGSGLIYFRSRQFKVTARPCPGCDYPIEKHLGCDFMQCIFCGQAFYWTDVHDQEHQLVNEAVFDHPVQYIVVNCGMMRRKVKQLSSRSVRCWLQALALGNPRLSAVSPHADVVRHKGLAQQVSHRTAKTSVQFLKEVFSFSEHLYLVIGIHVAKDNEKSKQILFLEKMLYDLHFLAARIQARVVFRGFKSILVSRETVSDLVSHGETVLATLRKTCQMLHRMPLKKQDYSWMEDGKLIKFLRYK